MDTKTYIAFIRNVMQGRQGLTKENLKDSFVKNGALNVFTHFTTGNVSFQFRENELPYLKQHVEKELFLILGRETPIFIRSLNELQALNLLEAFQGKNTSDIHERCITFLDKTPIFELPKQSKRQDLEVFKIVAKNVFSITRLINKRAGSPNKLLEKLTGQSASTRNINTVLRVIEKIK
ncbi:DUF1697 domain-containing protein [Flexithrix dorotheae]|uniref:DUF1697 domain-containing protein n=1 Tax=Flexithrix dorotheae TaxID=70993 RepID=UPI000377CB62|nr:DUF1697 domain-containing protein [Flexithrix dorotheae]